MSTPFMSEELRATISAHALWLRTNGASGACANLAGAELYSADLRGVNLRGANFQGAEMEGADLRGADLRGANLRAAILQDADLYGAEMEGADIEGAALRGADFRHATLPTGETWEEYLRDVVPALCQAGGHSLAEVAAAWECHNWANCPMAVAFGVHDVGAIPLLYTPRVKQFVQFFDAGLLPSPLVPSKPKARKPGSTTTK